MEEILILAVQFVLEVGLQLLGSIGFEWAAGSTARRLSGDGEAEERDGCGWLMAFAFFGALCGVVSLVLVSKPLLPNAGLRIANLVFAPLAAGGLSYLVAANLWAARGQRPRDHFWRGFWFALLFGLVRFAYLHR